MDSRNQPPPHTTSDGDRGREHHHGHLGDQPEASSTVPPPGDANTKDEESRAEPEPDHGPVLRGYRLYTTAIGVCLGALMMSLDISILGTALPSIMVDLDDTTANIAWYPASFTLATCALTPVAGKMASVFPLDLVYSSSTFVFLVGSILCGWAPSSGVFIAGRAVAGIGAAGVASNGLTILVTIAPAPRKPMFMGLGAACFVMGLIAGPLLGGVFADRLTWRWCFWINIPFNVLTLAVVTLFFRPAQGRGGSVSGRIASLDLIGCFIFVPGIFMFLLAMQTGGGSGVWDTPEVIGLLAGSGVTLLLFAAWERRRGERAMIPGSVALRRTVVFTCLFASTQMGGLTVASYYLPVWFQGIQGVGPLQSGVRMLPTVITQMVSTMVASGLALKIKYYNPWFFLAPIFLCTSSVLFTTFTVSSTPVSQWIGYQVIQGIGTGWGMQMSSLRVQLELKDSPELVPVGVALVMFVQQLGATVIQVIAGTVFNSQLSSRLGGLGLAPGETRSLLGAGITGIRKVAEADFPRLLDPILEAYNAAITRVFFVPVGSAAAGFIAAFGIKWTMIDGAAQKSAAEEDAGKATTQGNK